MVASKVPGFRFRRHALGEALVAVGMSFVLLGCVSTDPPRPASPPAQLHPASPIPDATIALPPSASPAPVPQPICGRLPADECDQVLVATRSLSPGDFLGPVIIVADYACGPGESCQAEFTALIVVVGPRASVEDGTARAFGVRGLPVNQIWREKLTSVPKHVLELVLASEAKR